MLWPAPTGNTIGCGRCFHPQGRWKEEPDVAQGSRVHARRAGAGRPGLGSGAAAALAGRAGSRLQGRAEDAGRRDGERCQGGDRYPAETHQALAGAGRRRLRRGHAATVLVGPEHGDEAALGRDPELRLHCPRQSHAGPARYQRRRTSAAPLTRSTPGSTLAGTSVHWRSRKASSVRPAASKPNCPSAACSRRLPSRLARSGHGPIP